MTVCNDNAYGLTASTYAARALGVAPPCVMQNDYSIINRRTDENGLSEASSPINENVGFMAYNVLGALRSVFMGGRAGQWCCVGEIGGWGGAKGGRRGRRSLVEVGWW